MSVRNYTLPFQGFDDHDSFSLEPQYGTLFRNVRSNRRRIVRAPGGTLMAPSPIPPGITSAISSGSFSSPTVTGDVVYSHSLGVAPAAFIFIGSSAIESTIANSNFRMLGMSDGVNSMVRAQGAQNGTNPTVSQHYVVITSSIALLATDGSNAVILEGDVTALDPATFTITWTTVDTVPHTIGYTIMGGSGVSAMLVNWNLNNSLGNQAVTGAGFTPQVVFHLEGPLSSARNGIPFGGMTTAGQFTCDDHAVAGSSPTLASRISSTSKALELLTGNPDLSLAVDCSFTFVSMDADGFTINVDNAPSSTTNIGSLCIAGMGNVKIGTFTKSVASAPVSQSVTGVGFKPDWIFLTGCAVTNNTPAATAIRSFGFGVVSGTAAWASMVKNGSSTSAAQEYLTDAIYCRLNASKAEVCRGTLTGFNDDGFTLNFPANDTLAERVTYVAIKGGATDIGVIRNYAQVYVGTGLVDTEKLLMLTSKSAFIYAPSTSSTGIWTPTSEVYTGNQFQRFSIVNTQEIAAWSQGVDPIRQWDGTTFSDLVTSGTNHAAPSLIAFADRIISIRPFFAGIDHATQIRWCINGNVNNWTGAGSGALEVIETSQNPLVTGFVLGERAYLAKERELIELIWTGTNSPVFGTTPRVRGMGVLAPFSVGLAEQFAFWLGPDDIYMWDGSTLTPVGDRVYNTIDSLIDYNNLDTIQAAVWTPDSLYLLVVPPYLFIYDYRRDIWYQDDTVNFEAIGIFSVGTNFTADIDHSEFIVIGDSAVQTVRLDQSLTSYLGAPIDSYWTTKDYTGEELIGGSQRGFQVSLWNINSLREVRFQSNPGYLVEVGVSTDRGTTWQTTMVTVNQTGVGVAWFQVPFSQIRFRFRDYGIDAYEIHGTWGLDFEDSGYLFP